MMIIVIQEALVERVNVLLGVLIRNSVDVLDRRLWRGTRVLRRGDFFAARKTRLLRPDPHPADSADQETSITHHDDVDLSLLLIAELAWETRRKLTIVVEEHQYG